MNKKSIKRPGTDAYSRIMEVATDLFFNQGYKATGINQIIEESGVAKATFYSHFKSKDELCRHYLEQLKAGELHNLSTHVTAARTARDRFMAPIKSLDSWLRETQYRGCPFVNIAAEIPDPGSPLRKIGMDTYNAIKLRIGEVCRGLVDSDPRYQHLDPEQLARDYLQLFAGAVALAELYHDIWPAVNATDAVARLID